MKTVNDLYNDLEKHFPMFFSNEGNDPITRVKLDHTLINDFKFFNDAKILISFKMGHKWSTRDGTKTLNSCKESFYKKFKSIGYEIDVNLNILVQG